MERLGIIATGLAAASIAGCVLDPPRPEPPAARPPVEEPASRTVAPPPPTPEQVHKAFTSLNEKLRIEYERAIDERGTRTVGTARSVAFDALGSALATLGMIVENRDPDVGTLTVAAPAPRPLSSEEWRRTVQSDLPMLGEVLCPILGPYCTSVKFEPDDYVIVINAVVRTAASGAEVSLTTRMREIVPRPGMPRRDYPPPTGVRMALDKIWSRFDAEIAVRRPATQ